MFSLSNVKNGENLQVTIIPLYSFSCNLKKFIQCFIKNFKRKFSISSAENGPQNLHSFSFAANSGNDCDEH